MDRTVYDSLYVALALTSKGQPVTADEKLANALGAHLPGEMARRISCLDLWIALRTPGRDV